MAEHARRKRAASTSASSVVAVSRGLRDKIFVAVLGLVMVFAGISTAGGTYAFWNDSATTDAGTLSTGTAVLEAKWAHEDEHNDALLPGEFDHREVNLRNGGDVALEISLAGSVDSPGFRLKGAAGSCNDGNPMKSFQGDATPLPSAGGRSGTFTVAPDSTSLVCVAIEATEDLEPGHGSSFTIRIEGKQAQ